MEIRFRKLSPEAVEPYRGSAAAAGCDLTAVSKIWDAARRCWIYGTGLAVEIPTGHVGLLFPRSSVFKTSLALANCVGVIDADFRGEIKVVFRELGVGQAHYEVGDRVAQLIVLPVPMVTYRCAGELSETERGDGGFGSTGGW